MQPIPSTRATTREVSSARPVADRAWPWALAALGLLLVGYTLAVQLKLLGGRLGLPLDDSWIHLQFARNLARGDGLSVNPGELVTGSTAPLWSALVAVLFLLPGNILLWVKALGAALHVAGGLLTFRLGRELGLGPGLAGLAGVLVVSSSVLVWAALSGMEVPLFVALTLAGLLLHLRERRAPERAPLALAVLGLALLARPEGALLLACVVLDRLLVFRPSADGLALARPDLRRLALGLAAVAVALAPVLVFYRVVGDTFLPTTFAAKTHGPRQWLPELESIYVVLGIFFHSQPWLPVLAPAGMLALLRRAGTRDDVGLALGLWPLALPLVYSTFAGAEKTVAGNFGRYYFPLVPMLALLAVLALDRLGPLVARPLRAGRVRLPLAALGVVVVLAPGLLATARGAFFAAHNVLNVEESDVRLARWLEPRLDRQALLAVNDIGALKFLLPNRVLDLAGIANPEAIEFYTRRMAELHCSRDEAALAFVELHRPDYLAVFPDWFPVLERLPERFPPLLRLPIRANVTMGGDELVLYATPWTRYPLRDLPASGGPAR